MTRPRSRRPRSRSGSLTLAETRKPGTLGQYLIAFRLLLDHVGLEPNAARDPRVKLPKQVREEPQPAVGRAHRGDPRSARREVEASVRHDRAGCAADRRGRQPALGRRRRRRPAAPTTAARRPSVTGLAGCICPQWLMEAIEDDVPARGSRPRAQGVPGDHRGQPRAQAMTRACKIREGAALPPARSSSSQGRRSGTSRVCLPASSRSGWGTRSRRCRWTFTRHVMPPDEIASERFRVAAQRRQLRQHSRTKRAPTGALFVVAVVPRWCLGARSAPQTRTSSQSADYRS